MTNNIAFIGLGSNQDSPEEQVKTSIKNINKNLYINILKTSAFYITKPYGYTNQNNFVNAVIKIKTSLDCFELLLTLQGIELKQKRIREIKWGPRTIDLDILAFNKDIINTPNLKIPHSDFKNREFVLKPWCEIEPEWVMPDGERIISHYSKL